MKNRLLVLAIAMVCTFTTAIAQQRQPQTVEERVTRTVERLKTALTLNEKQEKDIKPVYTDYYTAMDKLREGDKRPTPEERQKLNDDRDAKLKTILTEEQLKKLKEQEEQMRQRRRPEGENKQ